MRRATAAVTGAALLLVMAAGCERQVARTSADVLDRETSRSFKRAYDAWHTMTTGMAREKLVREARSTCVALGPNPLDERAWTWSCRMAYVTHAGARGTVVYRVGVDPRGCFSARSPGFPAVVPERILGRLSSNPLAHFEACPLEPIQDGRDMS